MAHSLYGAMSVALCKEQRETVVSNFKIKVVEPRKRSKSPAICILFSCSKVALHACSILVSVFRTFRNSKTLDMLTTVKPK